MFCGISSESQDREECKHPPTAAKADRRLTRVGVKMVESVQVYPRLTNTPAKLGKTVIECIGIDITSARFHERQCTISIQRRSESCILFEFLGYFLAAMHAI